MKQALDSAVAKARRRSSLAEEEARAFASALTKAVGERDEEDQRKRVVTADRTARVNFNGGGKASTLVLVLVVKPTANAIVVKITGATDDLDLFVAFGQKTPLSRAGHHATSPAHNETIVMRRDGTPPLRDGVYTIVVQQPANSKNKVSAELSVDYLAKGEPIPFAWETPAKVSFSTTAARGEASRLLGLMRSRKFEAFLAGWKAFERREPLALLLRVDTFSRAFSKLKMSKEELRATLPSYEPMLKRFPRYRDLIYGAWGSSAARSGDFKQADAIFTRAIKAMPRKVNLRMRFMEVSLAANKLKRAMKIGAAITAKKAPTPPKVKLLLGDITMRSGEVEAGAKMTLEATLDLGLTPPDAVGGLRILLEAKQYASVIKGITSIAARNPRLTDLTLECLRGLALTGQGKRVVALARLERLHKLCPKPEQKAIVAEGIKEIEKRFPE